GIAAGPRLGAGVEIERALLQAQLDQRDARHVDRDIEQEVAVAKPGVEHAAVILVGQRLFDKADAVFGGDFPSSRLGGDDNDLLWPHLDMAQQQGQNPLADAAETDDDEPSRKRDVFGLQWHEDGFFVIRNLGKNTASAAANDNPVADGDVA